jgi:predicted permease
MTESALLAVAGGGLGALIAEGLLRGLVAFAPPQLPRLDDVRAHSTLLYVAIAVTSISVFLFGVLPALASGGASSATTLRQDARSGQSTKRAQGIRKWLVASQMAIALVMLSGAGLVARSLLTLQRVHLGFRSEHLSILSLAFDWQRYDSTHTLLDFGERVERRLRAVPGIIGVTPVLAPPFQGPNINIAAFQAEGHAPGINNPVIPWEATSYQYFSTVGTPILQGRSFMESDDARGTLVAVVSESVAHRFWPAQNPIGQRIRFDPDAFPGAATSFYAWRTVVGVVADTRFRELRRTSPTVYLPWQQWGAWPGTFVAVRSAGSIGGLASAVRSALRDVDPTMALWKVRTMDELLGGPLGEPRLTAVLLTAFGGVALLLAAVGLYGAMSSVVREQTREIGIRMALGATGRSIRRAVLRQALVVAGWGAGVGLIAALAAMRLLRSLLFGVAPSDPLTLGVVTLGLLVVAAAAAYLPGRRATQVEPVRALQAE